MTRDELLDLCYEGTVILEGEEYDRAIVGITTDGQLVYDWDELVNVLMMEGMTDEEALDYLGFNTVRALPYMGDIAPVIMNKFEYEFQSGDTYSVGCYDGGDTMTEKDKMIQDLRMDNDKLHVLIRQYIEGVKNLTEENKQLRIEVAELKEKMTIMEKTIAEARDVSDFVM